MRSDQIVERWTGVALTLVGVVAILWLAWSDRLTLYIHPRYTAFTVAMALLAGLAVVAALIVRPVDPDEPALRRDGSGHHDDTPPEVGSHSRDGIARDGGSRRDPAGASHSSQPPTPLPAGRWRLRSTLRLATVLVTGVALIVLPPATLSSRARQERELVSSSRLLDSGVSSPVLAGADPSTFSVKDWAVLLRQGGASSVMGQQVDLSGYVLDQGDPNVFYVARLMMSCCAVDAQPVGVPVVRPGWRDLLPAGSWVAVKGAFGQNPHTGSRYPTAITPTSVQSIEEPRQPYVF